MKDLGISKKYLKFFVNNIDSRYLIIQGSRRSGKSFSIYKWLYFLSSGKDIETNLVVCASYPALQNAIQDFQSATNSAVENNQILGYHYRLKNGSLFQFKSFDEYTKAQGTSCTRLFIEEALNVGEDIITTLSMSCTKQIYFAYNPTKKSTIDKYISKDKKNFIKTTYKDNKYLTPEQISEFETIKARAMRPTATTLERYSYQVYVLGEFSSMAGKVFMEIYNCTDDEYNNIRAVEYYGLDFGFVDSKDHTVLVGAKIFNNCLYLKEYIFSNALSKDYDLAIEMYNAGVTPYDMVFADYGGMGKTRINALISASNGEWDDERISMGFQISNAVKGSIINGIQRMQQFDRIIITESSCNMREEFDRYELNDDGKEISKHQNCVDAARYAANTMIMMGIK